MSTKAKDIDYYRTKLLALRKCLDDLLLEMEAETPSTPRQRQNRRESRIINFDAVYRKKNLK